MKIKEISSKGLARELQISIAAAELETRLSAKIEDIKGTVQLKGFRPGKVPVGHIRKTHGAQLMSDVVNEAVQETSQSALTERGEQPAVQPNISLSGDAAPIMAGEADLVYDMKFEILPEIKLTDFSKIKAQRPIVKMEAARIDEALERLASQRKNFKPRAASAAAKKGDSVKMDFLGRVDGEPFEGGTSEGFDLELGSGQFIPGFEEQLVGKKAGAALDVKVTFPENYGNAELSGKEAVFEVKIHEVSEAVASKIDEDFATSLGMENLEKLRAAVAEQIGGEYEQVSRSHVKRQILDKLNSDHNFELPPAMVELEFNQIWQNFMQEIENEGKKITDLDESEDDLRKEYQAVAQRRVRTGLVLAEVGRINKVEVTEDELQKAMIQRVQQFPGQEQAMFEYFKNNQQAMAQLRAPIYEEKVIDIIIEKANVSDEEVSLEELMTDPNEAKPKKAAKKVAKSGDKKPAAKKIETKKVEAKSAKPPAKKAAAKKAPAKKAATKKAPAKKAAKPAAKKAPATKKPAKPAAKKAPAKKTPAKKK